MSKSKLYKFDPQTLKSRLIHWSIKIKALKVLNLKSNLFDLRSNFRKYLNPNSKNWLIKTDWMLIEIELIILKL